MRAQTPTLTGLSFLAGLNPGETIVMNLVPPRHRQCVAEPHQPVPYVPMTYVPMIQRVLACTWVRMGREGDFLMTDLSIEKPIPLPPGRVFDFVTSPDHVPSWWGPEGITLGECHLDFTHPGPWSSVMIEPENGWHRVSGEVLHVTPGEAVELSWAWHDRRTDERGHESLVRLSVRSDGLGGTILSMHQTGLADAESARLHHQGWASSLNRIGPLFSSP